MRLLVYILGSAAAMLTVAGLLFKMMHWPGTGYIITLGMGLLMICIPIYAIYRYNKNKQPNP